MSASSAKLGVGTAQFGLDYGVSNQRGRMAEAEAQTVVNVAAAAGVALLDTAAQYGEAEAVLGRVLPRPNPFRLVTKTARVADGVDRVEARARASLREPSASRPVETMPTFPRRWSKTTRLS